VSATAAKPNVDASTKLRSHFIRRISFGEGCWLTQPRALAIVPRRERPFVKDEPVCSTPLCDESNDAIVPVRAATREDGAAILR
jgi:hypothetical protein